MIRKPSGPTAGTLPLQIATTGQQGEGQRGYERGGQSNRTSFARAWAEDSRSLPSSVRSSDCQKKTVSSRVIIRQASSDKRLVTLRLFAERAAGLGRAPERSGGARSGPAGAWSTFTPPRAPATPLESPTQPALQPRSSPRLRAATALGDGRAQI